jgi:RNA polymerase sigma factor (sigma-70 family)
MYFETLDDRIAGDLKEEAREEEITVDAARIRDAIMQLPEGFRIVLSLYLLEGYDHEEIAQILEISSSTSRSQYVRARQKLAEILKRNE